MKVRKTELLAPAGSPDAFYAAIAAGADAVYMAGSRFNARIGATNFTPDELKDAFRTARLCGKQIYITLNTLVFDKNFGEACDAAREYLSLGADAFIVQDLGLAAVLREAVPGIRLHASTQMTCSTVAAAEELGGLGFERMVASRELDRENLKILCEKSPLEIEYFVHGALCVCHSGQCLFSSVVGKRSGNLGLCAQPCRMEYRSGGKRGYLLSLKDSCLAEELRGLREMGVASLKIEGRMKSPEYVFGVTSIYRSLLDENRLPTAEEIDRLEAIFSRGGFTNGYFYKKPGEKMFGFRSESDKARSLAAEAELKKVRKDLPKIKLDMSFTVEEGIPCRLTAEARGEKVEVSGALPERAISSPLTVERAEGFLSKLGSTPFEKGEIKISVADGLNLSPSAMNSVRREATALLEEKLCRFTPLEYRDIAKNQVEEKIPSVPSLRLVFESSANYTENLAEKIKALLTGREYSVFLPLSSGLHTGREGVLVPPLYFDSEKEELEKKLDGLYALGAREAICTNLGFIAMLKERGFSLHGSMRLNIANSESVALLGKAGFASATVSPELAPAAYRGIKKTIPCGAFAYGREPLMLLENCIISTTGKCRASRQSDASTCRASTELRDRTGATFPVIPAPGHRNIILNSLPTCRADQLVCAGLSFFTLYFTLESEDEILTRIAEVRDCLPPSGEYTRR